MNITALQQKSCHACFGKGYFSKLEVIIGYDDFGGEGFTEPAKIRFFRCKKCKSRKKLPKDCLLSDLLC